MHETIPSFTAVYSNSWEISMTVSGQRLLGVHLSCSSSFSMNSELLAECSEAINLDNGSLILS